MIRGWATHLGHRHNSFGATLQIRLCVDHTEGTLAMVSLPPPHPAWSLPHSSLTSRVQTLVYLKGHAESVHISAPFTCLLHQFLHVY